METFKEWITELKRIFRENNLPDNIDAESYREYYDEGETPQDVFDIDMDFF